MQPNTVRYYGDTKPLPEQIQLRAGPLSLLYENGDLRYVKLGNIEILRRVYVAVRDQNWGTIAPSLSDMQMRIDEDTFSITYDVEHKQGAVDFFWQGTITGDAHGTITFRLAGEARSSFQRNRIGFCVLHPMACADVPARIEHVDGSVEELPFPQTIARQLIKDGHPWPVAPFDNMRALSHQVSNDLWAQVRFEGDIFELEDQRNWTDASYKTYGTPLSLPFPVTVEAGTRIEQSITLTLEGDSSAVQSDHDDDIITLRIDRQSAKPLPQIGLGLASHGQPLNDEEIDRLQALNLHYLRVDLALAEPELVARLQQATAEAVALNVGLEIAIFLSDNADEELTNLAAQLDVIQPPIRRWLVFHQNEKTTSARWVDLAQEMLAAYDPSAHFGAGSNAYFTEINSVRPDTHNLDFITYSINPQVHAFDNSSLIETLEAQAVTVESAYTFSDGKEIVVSPVTLQPRFNPNATAPEPELEVGDLPPQVDVRQMSLFGAAWTVGSLKYLGGSDLCSVTYYETTGWRGIMETAAGSPSPDKFHSQPGMVFPLYHVLVDVGEFAEGDILRVESSDSLLVDGLALRQDGKVIVLVANMTVAEQQIAVNDLPDGCRVRYLDKDSFEQATQTPEEYRAATPSVIHTTDSKLRVTLRPYAVVRIDGISDST